MIDQFGADTLRLYEMFIGDFEKVAPWNIRGVRGCRRFLERVYNLPDFLAAGEKLQQDEDGYSKDLQTLMHQTINKVTNDILHLKHNTAIAQLMTLINAFYERKAVTRAELRTFLLLLNPFAPHITEEMWEQEHYSDKMLVYACLLYTSPSPRDS